MGLYEHPPDTQTAGYNPHMPANFSFHLIMSNVHHLSTEMEGKKPTKMHECTAINTNPNYPTR